MKLPRWLVATMLGLSVLAVLGAAGWWWVTWPERTAREFLKLLGANRWEEAQGLSAPESDFSWLINQHLNNPDDRDFISDVVTSSTFEPIPRTFADVLIGRQAFRAVKQLGPGEGYGRIEFEIVCGRLRWLSFGAGDLEEPATYLPTWEIQRLD